jgi:hypothetical protein
MNAAAKVVPLRNESNEDSDPIVSLLAERKRVSEELARLAAIDEPVRMAEAALNAVDRAIDGLDAEQRDRAQEWAASGTGELPESKTAERRSLVARRAELQSDLDSARNRVSAIAPRRHDLHVELNRIARENFLLKVRKAISEGQRLHDEAHSIVQQALEPLTRLQALRQALISAGNSQENQGADGAAREAFSAAEAIGNFPAPQITYDGATINRMTAEWQEKFR